MLTAEARQSILDGTAAKKRTPRARKRVVSIVAACLVLALGVTVVASTIFDSFINRMGEDYRSHVYAVNQTDTQAGIRMDVAAAVNDGYQSVVYLSMQDVTADRIDNTTQLYNVQIAGTWFSHGEQVHFEEATGTATFRLSGSALESLSGQETTVTVGSILSGVSHTDSYDTGLTLAALATAYPLPEETEAFSDEYGYSFMHGSDQEANERFLSDFENYNMPMLPLGSEKTPVQDLSWLSVSNAGLINNRFHVQFALDEDMGRFNLFAPQLTWPQQTEDEWLGFGTVDRDPYAEVGYYTYYRYQEYIFDLPPDVPLEDIAITGWCRQYETHVEGNWSAAFTVAEDVQPRTAAVDVQLDDFTYLEKVEVTSIGVAVHFSNAENYDGFLLITVFLKDGTIVETPSTIAMTAFGEDEEGNPVENSIIYNAFARPINLDQVDRVEINGQAYPLR